VIIFVPAGPEVPRFTPILPARAAVPLGRVRAAFFVPDEDVLDPAVLAQGFVQGQDRGARDAENQFNTLALEDMNRCLHGRHFWHRRLSLTVTVGFGRFNRDRHTAYRILSPMIPVAGVIRQWYTVY